MLHHIQRTVLDRLATAESLLYSEIKPNDLDGNVFGYHLKSLLQGKYVTKNQNGSYSLLSEGREYIVRRYENPSKSARSIFLLVIRNGDRFLLRTRGVQPLLGYTGFIHGEPDPGASILEAAQRRLRDKTGLDVALEIKGSALISQSLSGELHSYSHAVILYGETNQTNLKTGDETGENFWGTLETVENILPSCRDIVAMLEANKAWLEKSYAL